MKKTSKQTLAFFYKHIRDYKFSAMIVVFAIILAVCFELVSPYFYKRFFDTIILKEEVDILYGKLLGTILALLGLGFGHWLFWRIAVSFDIYLVGKVMVDIYNYSFEYLHQHSYNFFNSNFVGSLVKRVSRLVRAFEVMSDKVLYDLIPLGLKLTVSLIMLSLTNKLIGGLFFVWAILFISFNYVFTLYKFKYDVAKAEADSKNIGFLADTIANHVNLKLFANLAFELRKFQAVTGDWLKKTFRSWNLDNLVEGIQGLMMITMEFLLYFVGLKYWRAGMLTVGDFILIQSYLFIVFSNLWSFGRVIRAMYEGLADAEEMITVLNIPFEVANDSEAKNLVVKRGEIEFKNVTFIYGESGIKVLDKVSFKIKPGEKVALVGLSGGGKSTVVQLLVRFYDINKGQILVDGQDIKKVTLDSLRRQISLVPQDPILFHRSLMANIGYGRKEAGKKEIVAVSKLAYCDSFVKKFPKKYNTFVGERGVKLSGGQRQRVAIARAILQNAPILVLDEATSSLDSYSEKLIQKALYNLMKHKTSLVIAHRLSTISQMDRILVLDKGKIIEQGTHKELLQKSGTLYGKLWKIQRGEGVVEEETEEE